MKYTILLLSLISFSCTKEVIPTISCTSGKLEVVNTDVSNWVQVYINGSPIGIPILPRDIVMIDTLKIGATYYIEAVNTTNHNSVTYPVTLTNIDCGAIAVQDVNP